MRRIFISAILAFCLIISGCDTLSTQGDVSPAINNTPIPVQTAMPTPAPTPPPLEPFAGCAIKSFVVCYPEGSTETNAEYILRYQLPVFESLVPGYAGMNAAVSMYKDELIDKVVSERLPKADTSEGGTPPSTVVTAQVDQLEGFVNIVFRETVTFGDNKQEAVSTLVLDSEGKEQPLHSVAGLYAPEALVAQQVLNQIAQAPDQYYSEVSLNDVMEALDLYNGYNLTPGGFMLYLPAGSVAPAELGGKVFEITREQLYPAFVGDLIPMKAYPALKRMLDNITRACLSEFKGFENGEPSQYAATLFMAFTLGNGTDEVTLDAGAYEAQYIAHFNAEKAQNPLLDTGYLNKADGGYAIVPDVPLPAFGFEAQDAVADDASNITISGTAMFGVPGSLDWGELAAVRITLAPDANSEAGYKLSAFEIK